MVSYMATDEAVGNLKGRIFSVRVGLGLSFVILHFTKEILRIIIR